ncbi:MAG: GTPase Era [Mycoplasmatales bacterium]
MYKSGFVSVVGSPNAGKSTFLNTVIGYKVSITSSKVQTTRNNIRGIYHEDDLQIVFLDTPGIHKPQNKLQEFMNDQIDEAISDNDLIIYMIDAEVGLRSKELEIIERLSKTKVPKIAVVNKIDLVNQETAQNIILKLMDYEIFHDVIAVSLRDKFNHESVLKAVKNLLPEGNPYYEKGQVTDSPEAFIISEIIREKVIERTAQEIPHSVSVKTTSIKKKRETMLIDADIYVQRNSQKGIIIGEQGKKLKEIGYRARKELEEMYGLKVYLTLHVKLLKNWSKNVDYLEDIGYSNSLGE